MSIEVRPVVASDRDDWARLFVAYGVFYETAFSDEVVDGVWAWLMDAGHSTNALVAVSTAASAESSESDAVVGFAIYRPVADTFTAAYGWFLDDLYVDPSARGTGAATALIEAIRVIAHEAGGGTLRWITAADNVRAQSVYDKVASRQSWVTYEIDA